MLPQLCYRTDRRSLCFLLAALGMLLLPHFTPGSAWLAWLGQHATNPLVQWPLTILWLTLSSLFCFLASIINHNHMHCPMFRSKWPNFACNLFLSLARGHTATGIVVPHNMNHHVHAGNERDWIRPALAGQGRGWWRLLRYVLLASLEMLRQRVKPDAPKLPRRYRSSLWLEKAFLYLAVTILLLHDWRVFLLFNLLPWLLGLAMLVGVNLLQHDGCIPVTTNAEDSHAAAPSGNHPGGSRDFTGKAGNWLFFNNGYHNAHHLHPRAHWSTLPALHERMREDWADAPLEQTSILTYLWWFGWTRHDGREVPLN